MKIFISADIEGTAGIATWSEADRTHPDYPEFRRLMTQEVLAACEGAREAGEIVVKDAHNAGRNLILDMLPDYVSIVRAWSGHPDVMMFGIDAGCHAALYTGYHSHAGSDANPLAHTLTLRFAAIFLNGRPASELELNARCAALYGVPSVFVSGDAGLCRDAGTLVPGIHTVPTLRATGPATRSVAPVRARALIREGVRQALSAPVAACVPAEADSYELKIVFTTPGDAYRASWYPGAKADGSHAVVLTSRDFRDIQRVLLFLTK